jgi:hypothetical protein
MNDPVQNRKSFEVLGDTVRWSRYGLLNGVVVPAEGADLEVYDPWDNFRTNAGKYRTVDQPYAALLELHRNLDEAASRGIQPSYYHPKPPAYEPIVGPRTEADELILAWCNQHGLLGLVPVLSSSIRMDPTSEKGFDFHYRDGGVWQSMRAVLQAAGLAEDPLHSKVNQPSVTWFDGFTHFDRELPLSHLERFFRRLYKKEPLRPPCPNTRSFWKIYGEPLQHFEQWCHMFAWCVIEVSRVEPAKGDILTPLEAHRVLSGLAQRAAPTFLLNQKRNTIDEARVSAGLLASYALMFLWDRMEGRRALQCENCDSYFISDDPRARYCSPRCRNTAQKRRSRAKTVEN